jgi:hypothetical protein
MAWHSRCVPVRCLPVVAASATSSFPGTGLSPRSFRGGRAGQGGEVTHADGVGLVDGDDVGLRELLAEQVGQV